MCLNRNSRERKDAGPEELITQSRSAAEQRRKEDEKGTERGWGRNCKIESTVIAIPFCVEVTHVEFMTVEFSFVRILKRGIEQKLTKVTKEKSGVKERSHGNLRHGQVKTSVPDPATLMAMAIGDGHDDWTARSRPASWSAGHGSVQANP